MRDFRATPAAGQQTGGSLNSNPDYTTTAAMIKLNRRYYRATLALLKGPVDRKALDSIVGTTNAPQYVKWLRELGLSILTERVSTTDKDNRSTWFGRYHLSSTDRQQLRKAFAELGVKL